MNSRVLWDLYPDYINLLKVYKTLSSNSLS